jgi:hypothetical protein
MRPDEAALSASGREVLGEATERDRRARMHRIATRHHTQREQAQSAARIAAAMFNSLADELGPENPCYEAFAQAAQDWARLGSAQPQDESGEPRTLRLLRSP